MLGKRANPEATPLEVDCAIHNHGDYEIQGTNSSYLVKADCVANNNKYYICQVLKEKKANKYFLYTRYGRVGDPGMKNMASCSDEGNAIKGYEKTIKQKQSKAKGYTVIDMKLGASQDNKTETALMASQSSKPKVVHEEVKYAPSTLAPQVQEFCKLVFDKKLMEQSVMRVGFDLKKLPLE